MPLRPTRRATAWLAPLAALLAAAPVLAQPPAARENPGRRERGTPGLVLETGARTAACDVLTFTADGRHLLAAGDDKVVRTWAVSPAGRLGPDDLPTLRWPIFREMNGNIYAAALSPDGSQVLVAGHGQLGGGFAAAVIDRKSGKVLRGTGNPEGQPQQGAVWAAAFSPSGKRAALGAENGSVWVWDLSNGKLDRVGKHRLPEGADRWLGLVRLVAFADEDRVLSVGAGELRAWSRREPDRDEVIARFAAPSTTPAARSANGRWVGVIPEGLWDNRGLVELVSPADGERRTLPFDRRELPHRLAFSPSGRYLAVAVRRVGVPGLDGDVTFYQEYGGRVLVYDLTKPDAPPAEGPAQGLYAEQVAFDPKDESRMAVAGGDNHEVELWDWKARKKLGEVPQPGRCLWGVALAPDGHGVAFQERRDHAPPHPNRRGEGPWRYFDLAERRLSDKPPFDPTPAADALKSAGGWKVVTLDPRRPQADVWVVESPDGRRFPLPWSRTQDELPRCYAFLPGSPVRLIVGHYWGASVFELTADGPRRTRLLRGHEGYVTALAADPHAKRLVTASRDMTLAGWSLEGWDYHPRLGAELFVRGGKLMVGKIAPGSPFWEMGLSEGDELVAIRSAVRLPGGGVRAEEPYVGEAFTHAGMAVKPAGTPEDAIKYLAGGNPAFAPGEQHLFYWRSPGDPALYSGATTLVERPLWRFFPHAGREWVLWQWRDYYYDCSTNGDFSIGWQRNDPKVRWAEPAFFRAEQLRGEFLKPATVSRTLATWRTRQDALVAFNRFEPPAVELGDPKEVMGGYEVKVTARAAGTLDAQRPERLLVWLNDYLLADLKGPELPVADGSATRVVSIPADKLRGGPNVVAAQCYARAGSRGDAAPRVVAHPGGSKPVLRALLVGVGDYSRSKPRQVRLKAGEDAEVLARALQAQRGKAAFADVRVTVLPDRRATRDAILAALDALKGQVKPDDLLVFHLGGHGTSLAELEKVKKKRPDMNLAGLGRFLFLCGDFNLDRPQDTTVGFEDLHERLNKLPCHKLLLLDACHSGEARTAGGDTDANPVRILTQHGVGCVILAACGPDEQAIENDALDLTAPGGGGHGLFTVALRRLFEDGSAFTAADRNGDGRLDAAELAGGVKEQVKRLVDRHNALLRRAGEPADEKQTPVAFVPSLEERVPVAAK